MLDIILITVGAIGILVGTITDIQRREVADWINFSLIFAGFGIRSLYSAHTLDPTFIIGGILGFSIAFIIGMLMYYTGQWGGGDAKMLFGLGALFGTYSTLPLLTPHFLYPDTQAIQLLATTNTTATFIIFFFINTMIVGALYGVVWSLAKCIQHHKKIAQTYKQQRTQTSRILIITGRTIAILSAIAGAVLLLQQPTTQLRFVAVLLCMTAFLALLFPYLKTATKALEQATMIHHMHPKQITEGEWVQEDIHIGGEKIAEKNTKLNAQHIRQLNLTPSPILYIKIPFTKHPKQIPLYEFEDHMTLAKPFRYNNKTITTLNKQSLYELMTLVIKERSRLIKIKNEHKLTHESKLKPGDIIEEDLYTSRLTIITAHNLGIDRYQIHLLQKYINRTVLVKIGIPFIPAFLGGFVLTILCGPWILYVL